MTRAIRLFLLSLGVVFGVLVSLWSANGGMKGLFDALNVVYGEEEKRSFLWLNLTILAFTLGMRLLHWRLLLSFQSF